MSVIRSHMDIFRDSLEFIQENSPVYELNRWEYDSGVYQCCNGPQEYHNGDYVHSETCSWKRLILELRSFIEVEEMTGFFFGKHDGSQS